MNKIMSQCSFSSTSYVPAATSAVASITVMATKPTVTGTGAAGGTGSVATAKGSSTGTGGVATPSSGTSDGVSLKGAPLYGMAGAVFLAFGLVI